MLDGETAEMRTVRGTLDALRPAAAPALTAFADSFVRSAESATEERPGAGEPFRVAVTQTAAAAAAADPWTADAQTAYAAYRDAFGALVDDQLRAEREEADRRAAEQQPSFPQNPQNGGTTPPDPIESPAPTDPDTQEGEGTPNARTFSSPVRPWHTGGEKSGEQTVVSGAHDRRGSRRARAVAAGIGEATAPSRVRRTGRRGVLELRGGPRRGAPVRVPDGCAGWIATTVLAVVAGAIQIIVGFATALYRGRFTYGSFDEVRTLAFIVVAEALALSLVVIPLGPVIGIPERH